MADIKHSHAHVEVQDGDFSDEKATAREVAVMGTVKLTDGAIIYVPRPTADPQDPLNMPMWQKFVVMTMLSTFSALGLSLISGLGGLLSWYIPEYSAQGYGYADISALLSYPALFMGLSNLVGIPMAIAVGRRATFLVSTLILVLGSVLCATAKSYEWHLGARCVLSLAAGQSESLVPMITQEIFFLHERSRGIMIQTAIQTTMNAVWVLCASPIADGITAQGWYGLGAGLAGVQFVLSIFLLPETKYQRPLEDFQESSNTTSHTASSVESGQRALPTPGNLVTVRPPLDFERYSPRTWKSDMRLWVDPPEWSKGLDVLKNTVQLLFFPNVFWAMCLNGLTLGVNVGSNLCYGSIVEGPPYNWAHKVTSFANTGQIVVAIVALPILGFGNDKIIKWRAQRNGGVHEPEARILTLIFPIIVGIPTIILYGQGGSHPTHYHWFTYVWGIAAIFFCFLGANIVGITYLLDSYPARTGPLLVIICAFRGIIAFGVSFAITPGVESMGYDKLFGMFGGLTALLGLLGIPIYIWGKEIRRVTGRWARSKTDKTE